jgi:autotransporter passenger strand-loop-strand repeat protein
MGGGLISGQPSSGTGDSGILKVFGSAAFVGVSSGGKFIVSAGGIASDFTVSSGGVATVLGTVTSNALILHGGTETVSNHGLISGQPGSGTTDSGTLNVLAGGSATHVGVASGGKLNVNNGGVTSDTLVESRGQEIVAAGAVARAATISGGTLEIMSAGSTGTGGVTFASGGGGILQLDSSLTFLGGLVAGFGGSDKLDFRDIPFTSGKTGFTYTQDSQNPASGTLRVEVASATSSASITLIGQYIPTDFRVSTDGHGGTFVTAPSVSASETVALVNPHQT